MPNSLSELEAGRSKILRQFTTLGNGSLEGGAGAQTSGTSATVYSY